MYKKGIPRSVEIVLALVGLIVTAPMMLFCALLVRISSPGYFLFRQKRVGLNGKIFNLVKLRTMHARKGDLITSASDPRITSIGRILRKTKLDEVPELWNILCGDMSFVGPRPEVPEYVDLSDPLWQKVLLAKPGMTDSVTLKLLNEGSILEKVADKEKFYREVLQPYKLKSCIKYLENRSFYRDSVVILQTVFLLVNPYIVINEEELLSEMTSQKLNYSGNFQGDAI